MKAQSTALRYMKRMLKDRGYPEGKEKVVYNEKQKLVQMSALTELGERLLVVLTPIIRVPLNHEEVDEVEYTGSQSSSTIHADAKNADNQKSTGSDFIKSLMKYCTEKKVTQVILVTDDLSPYARKEITKHPDIRVTCFSYTETLNPAMGRHVDQPMSLVKLSPSQRKEYITKNPLYEKEIARCPEDDILIRYFGLKAGDIFYTEENDNGSEFCFEYAMVVHDL